MLAKWILIVVINGQNQIVIEKPSEALCNQALVKMIALQQVQGKEATAACYVRTTETR